MHKPDLPNLWPPVLAYHKVGTPEWGGTWCTRRQFASHLQALRREDFTVLDSQGYGQPTKTKSVLLTFDDAFESFAQVAWPELQKQRMSALLFVITDYVGCRSTWDLPLPGRRVKHLDWSQLRRLQHEGVEIGSHTCRHTDLTRLGDPELWRELSDSKRILEDHLGMPVTALSYPFGRWSPRVVEASQTAGYSLGFTMGPVSAPWRSSPLLIRRWGVYITDTPRTVLDKIDPRRRGNRFQDLYTRGISRVAALSAALGQRDGRTSSN